MATDSCCRAISCDFWHGVFARFVCIKFRCHFTGGVKHHASFVTAEDMIMSLAQVRAQAPGA